MSLCDLNCCDLKYLQRKFDAINKKINDNQKIQDKINANIFELLKESGIDVEKLLKNYYALNEDDYTKTLTSDDDINTLEPGTYKIVKTDMPQNAPNGITSTGATSREYNGTLIISNSYEILFKNGFDVCFHSKTSDETWTEWERIAFMSDVPSLKGYATQEWVNQLIQDITGGSVTADWVKSNYYALTNNQYMPIPQNTDYNTLGPGCYLTQSSNLTNSEISSLGGTLLLIKFDTYYNNVYRTIIYNFTNNKIYFCDSTATQIRQIKQIAYMESIPDLSGYVTQSWVQSQNYLTEIPDEYATETEVTQAIAAALVGYATQEWVNEQIREITGGAVTSEVVSQMISNAIVGYATQTWVNQQGFLTEIPEEYVTLTELQAQNYATQSWVNSQGFIKGNMTLYTTVDQLDISYPTTTLNVFKAMANNSLLIFGTDTTYITDLPVNSGILEITKVSNIRYKIVLYKSSGGTNPVIKGMCLATTNSTLDNLTWEAVVFTSDLNNEATQEWVEQQGYQTVQQVNSLINTATADMLTQEDLDTLNYATENWVLQTALDGYATENWVNTKLNNYLPKKETIALTTQGTYYGLQYQWVRYGQVVEVFLVGNLTQEISNQLISNFCPANPMGTLQITIAGYDSKTNYAEFNGNGLKLMGTYSNELYVNCHFTYLTNE